MRSSICCAGGNSSTNLLQLFRLTLWARITQLRIVRALGVIHGRAVVLLLSGAHWIQRRVRELNEGVSSEVEPGPWISNFNTYIYDLAHTTKLVRMGNSDSCYDFRQIDVGPEINRKQHIIWVICLEACTRREHIRMSNCPYTHGSLPQKISGSTSILPGYGHSSIKCLYCKYDCSSPC